MINHAHVHVQILVKMISLMTKNIYIRFDNFNANAKTKYHQTLSITYPSLSEMNICTECVYSLKYLWHFYLTVHTTLLNSSYHLCQLIRLCRHNRTCNYHGGYLHIAPSIKRISVLPDLMT